MPSIIHRLLQLWAWLCGLFGSAPLREPEPGRQQKRRTLRHLPIQVFPQTTPYSCTASVLQSALHSLTGEVISHERAIELMECHPDGAHLVKIASVLRRECGVISKRLRTLGEARKAIRAGKIVISCDDVSYGEPHAVLLVGATPAGCYLADSNQPTVRWKNNRWLRRTADEFIAVGVKPRAKKRVARAR